MSHTFLYSRYQNKLRIAGIDAANFLKIFSAGKNNRCQVNSMISSFPLELVHKSLTSYAVIFRAFRAGDNDRVSANSVSASHSS